MWGSGGTAPRFLASTLEGERQLHAPTALSRGIDGLDAEEKRKILPLPGTNPGRPARRHTDSWPVCLWWKHKWKGAIHWRTYTNFPNATYDFAHLTIIMSLLLTEICYWDEMRIRSRLRLYSCHAPILWDSSVGTATGLWAARSRNRDSVPGRNIQIRSRALTMGTEGWPVSTGIKRPRREADHLLQSTAEVKNGGAILPVPHAVSGHRS
jgi:hypothetical protein